MKELRRFTMARVGPGRAGNSLPTRQLLDFQPGVTRARDAPSLLHRDREVVAATGQAGNEQDA